MKRKEDISICENCGYPINDCKCFCLFCDESSDCHCCIGNDKSMGG